MHTSSWMPPRDKSSHFASGSHVWNAARYDLKLVSDQDNPGVALRIAKRKNPIAKRDRAGKARRGHCSGSAIRSSEGPLTNHKQTASVLWEPPAYSRWKG
ncbi:hypothetical protein Mapa_009458 [Marchantia paleacea]|nr:hypothetical protein Mapa_009458 [Marchantia paleacea]